MFTIDLLKGQGIPVRSRPWGIALAVVTFAVPIIIAMAMFSYYLHARIVTSIQRQGIVSYEAKIGKLSDAIELQKSFEEEKAIINNCLSEVSDSIGRYIQWSPILVTLVRNLPDSLVLTGLEVKQRSIKRKVPRKDAPGQMVDVSVPVKTLQMNVCVSPQANCDKVVRDFRNRLRFSSFLGPKLENIEVSQEFATVDGQDVVSYEIDCIFKPEL